MRISDWSSDVCASDLGPGPGQGERPQRSHPTGPTVGKIVVEGTQRIDPTTVRSYMAIKEGDALDPDAVNQSLKTLFATGLFSDVTIRREGDTLVVDRKSTRLNSSH